MTTSDAGDPGNRLMLGSFTADPAVTIVHSSLLTTPDKRLIALTGASGFIGQHLLRELPKYGYRVRALLQRPSETPFAAESVVIGDIVRPGCLSAALEGCDTVIHAAGVAHRICASPVKDYQAINTEATINLAHAAQRSGVRRFVFLSSIAAQSGPSAEEVLTEVCEPNPTDPYGRSKLAAERGLAQIELDWVALRLVLVYGAGVKGNMAALVRLARSPCPLPLATFTGRRSLLSIENLTAAIATVLAASGPLRRPFVVADREALTVPMMITALRRGLGRRPGLVAVQAPLLRALLSVIGRTNALTRLSGSLIADSSALLRLGWSPTIATPDGLARLAQEQTE